MFKSFFESNPKYFSEIREGLEKECLRVNTDGTAAKSKHMMALGHKLTHNSITTDYAENLLEFITPVFSNTDKMLKCLEDLHAFTVDNIGDELLWPSSMPAILASDDNQISVADYGKSNTGKLKTLYRVGLGKRYGRKMQSIAGVHYNFSLSDDFWKEYKDYSKSSLELKELKSESYFALIRNYKRYAWVLKYLFGASNSVDESFLFEREHNLDNAGNNTFQNASGTSLRMGGLGYTSDAQKEIHVCFNKVETYIKTLEEARQKEYIPYKKIGLFEKENRIQLNNNLLQIDNEYYSTIRPKNIAKSGESALQALHNRGIEYIEVRLLDLNPFLTLGVDKEQIQFLHTFLIWCLMSDSPGITERECNELECNFQTVVKRGLRPDAQIEMEGHKLLVSEALTLIFERMKNTLSLMGEYDNSYLTSFQVQGDKIKDSSKLPSVRLLAEQEGVGFVELMRKLAFKNKEKLSSVVYDKKCMQAESDLSHRKNNEMENAPEEDFEAFLVSYFKSIKI